MEPFCLNKSENGVWYFNIPEFDRYGFVKTFFTTRIGGVSDGDFSTLNFGGYSKDAPDNVDKNRKLVFEALGIEENTVKCFAVQVHEDTVAALRSPELLKGESINLESTDAMITDLPGMVVSTRHADCLPLYFLDPVNKAVGAAHAGWRGTALNIAEKTVKRMQEEFGSEPGQLLAAVGPGISLCCFETGPEVYQEFAQTFDDIDKCAVKKDNGKYMLDLKKINELQLKAAGVGRVLVSNYCTYCEEELLFSHRRDNGRTGRMGAGIVILP